MKKWLYILCLFFFIPVIAQAGFIWEIDGSGHSLEMDGGGANELYLNNEEYKMLISGAGNTLSYTLIDAGEGGVYLNALKITGINNIVENVTIYNPTGIALDADESCTVTNTILYGYDKDVDVAAAKTVTAKNNCLPNHASATDNIGDGTYAATDCIFVDPLFFDEVNQDYHLSDNSPCIGTGDDTGPGVDPDGIVTPRGVHDIGCYEYVSAGEGIVKDIVPSDGVVKDIVKGIVN